MAVRKRKENEPEAVTTFDILACPTPFQEYGLLLFKTLFNCVTQKGLQDPKKSWSNDYPVICTLG